MRRNSGTNLATGLTVSIVTPSLNHGEYLEAAIRSVLEQDYPNLESFVADGGSTDRSLSILRALSAPGQFGPRLRWISQPDRGQADAINKGFEATSGDILGWLNSDDTLAPGAISVVADFFAAHPDVGIVYGDAQFIDAAGEVIGPCRHIEKFNRGRLLHYADYIVQPAAFFRRTVFKAVGGLDRSLNWAMDYDLWLKASAITRVEYIPHLLANYRWLGNSKTASGGEARLQEVTAVARRYGASGMPAYFRLEAVRMALPQAMEQLRRGRLDLSAMQIAHAAAMVLASPRAIRSLLSLQTWQTIWMGRQLRRRS